MKSFFISLVCILVWSQAIPQNNLAIGLGQTSSTFLFKTSQGNKSGDYNAIINHSNFLQYRGEIAESWYFNPELTYKKIGASASFDGEWNSWDLDYFDLAIGSGLYVKSGSWQPYFGFMVYASLLLRGQQISGDSYFNIKEEKSIKFLDFGISPMIGVDLLMVHQLRIFAETRYSFGLNQLENTEATTQKLFNRYLSVYMGIRIPF